MGQPPDRRDCWESPLPLISGDLEFAARLRQAIAGCRAGPPDLLPLTERSAAVDHLNLELPDLVLIRFPDTLVDTHALLEDIQRDPWLIHAGIIALCGDDDTVERIENMRGMNLVSVLSLDSVEHQLTRVLDIIHDNRRILFQRVLGPDLMQGISGHFKLANDPVEARCYANLISNFLYNANRIDAAGRDGLNLAMYEMLMNAIEHGSCGIDYEEKTNWLESDGSMEALIASKCADPAVAARQVTFEYTISTDASRFIVADEGAGFDWRRVQDSTDIENLLKPHGRGILMARSITRNLNYNEAGNEVRFEVPHRRDEASSTPEPLKHIAPRQLAPGEIVFEEGSPGNFLYYIVKGRFEVVIGGRVVATLSPDDIFLGEMSFLLNNRRSATVRAASPGELTEISKREFLEAVKIHPHYALLLSRLLAQRIERANRLSGAVADGITGPGSRLH